MKPLIALLVVLLPALASACQISSHGHARPKPDRAFLFFRVLAQDEDPELAKKKVGDKSAKLTAALTGAGVDAKNIRSSEISEANPDFNPQPSPLAKVAQWTVAELLLDAKKSEDENLQVIAKVSDAAVAAGADPATFGGTEDSMFGMNYYQRHRYNGTMDLNQNTVLFSLTSVDAHVEKAMTDAIARANAVADVIGRIIQDKPQGIDSISVGKTPADTEWHAFDLGTASPTSDAVDVDVTVDTAIRYSHGDTTVGGSAHAGHGDHDKKEGITATGTGRLPVPIEQVVLLHRKSISQKTVVESLAKLKTNVDEIRKKLVEAKLGDHQFSTSGVGFMVGGSQMEMAYSMSAGAAPKLKTACYRNLSLTVARKPGESLIDFQTRVDKFQKILTTKEEQAADASQAALQTRYYGMQTGNLETAAYYMALDMQAYQIKLLEAAFADAKAQAERAARVTSQQLAGIHSTHPDNNIPLSDFLSTLKLGTNYSSDGLKPNVASQSMDLSMTVEYKTNKPEKK